MRWLSLIFMLNLCSAFHSQAQVEPQFKFYLAFEDATEQRDTVWIVIDTNAVLVEDTIFNEWILPIDSHNFDVYFGINRGIGDSSKSVYARQTGGFTGYINAVNFTNPTIIRWDTNLLVNHSLINPYKQIWIRTENNVSGEFHLYDTLFLNQGIGEIIVDSVILNGNLEHFPIQLYLGTLPINTVGIEHAGVLTNRHFIYPNPTNSSVQLKVSSENWPVSYEIFDLKGSNMKQGVLHNS